MQLSFQDFLYNNIFLKSTLHAARKRIFWKQQTEKPDITRMKVQYEAKIYSSPVVKSKKNYQIIKGTMNPAKLPSLNSAFRVKRNPCFQNQKSRREKEEENCIATNCSERGHCENRTRDLLHPKQESYH